MKYLILFNLIVVGLAASLNQLEDNPFDPKDAFIVGGEDVQNGQVQYQVSLEEKNSHGIFDQFCGGTIIDEHWILTAAHCVLDNGKIDNSTIHVRYNSLTDNVGGEYVNASQIIVHESFNYPWKHNNDIALIKLANPLKLNQTNANKIALPPAGYDPTSGNITVSGWGKLHENDFTYPAKLQMVSIPVISRNECRKAYENRNHITENMFCAGRLGVGGLDSCKGDSGGPVVQSNMVVGVVSWGHGCAQAKYPGVYTTVGNYIPWIKDKGVPV